MIQRITMLRILFSLPKKEHRVSNAKINLTPSIAVFQSPNHFMCTDNIGLYLSPINGDSLYTKLWIIHSPIMTVQALRALRLLDKCPIIDDYALCACYYAMRRDLDDTARHYIASLKGSGFIDIEDHRKSILADKINRPYFIENILNPITDAGGNICAEEIQREINLGILTNDASKRFFNPLKNQVAV